MPEGLSNFYILRKGLLAALDGELIEEDYDDIEEENLLEMLKKAVWY